MFARPRPKKSPLPPPSKKRKNTSAIEEISFDTDARQEYLTGFHKRKLQRIKSAQEEAAKKARQEKLEARKQVREERKRDVEDHVETVNRMLRESGAITSELEQNEEGDEEADEWTGCQDQPDIELVDHEEEYIDEDRYTTVTVESVSVSRDGLEKPEVATDKAEDKGAEKHGDETAEGHNTSSEKPRKPRKKKFRYETKFERQLTERKQKAQGRSRGKA